MKKILIVLNPSSGVGVPVKAIDEYCKRLRDKGYDVDLSFTKRGHHATEIVEAAANYDVVFSIGGDGTLNEVVNGNAKRKNKMTICPFPTGSCNDVASMLGYNKSLLENLDIAFNSEEKSIDIGTINDSCFTYVVGMGKFLNIPYETTKDKKSKLGYLAYIKEGIKEFFNKPKVYKTKVEVDGVKVDGEYSMVLISNSNHIAGLDGFQRDVKLDDEKFEILLCSAKTSTGILTNFIDFYLGGRPKDIISLKGNDINISFDDTLDKNWCIDGEELKDKSKSFHIKAKDKMKFLVPKEKVNKLFIKEI